MEVKKILLIDDSRISRLMLKAIIQNEYPDWQIDEAENAEAALDRTQSDSYDLMTLDMNMPGRDGLAVAPELQSACPEARIALLTANYQDRVKNKAAEQGLTFIPKPITEDKILDYLESVV